MSSDMERARLLAYELRTLLVRMRLANDPFADLVEHIADRFLADGDLDRLGRPAEEIRAADGSTD